MQPVTVVRSRSCSWPIEARLRSASSAPRTSLRCTPSRSSKVRCQADECSIYSHEDRFSAHRNKADEAYLIKGATPVQAYLNQDEIIRIALEHGVDMIHPGYGFLSENAEFAAKVEAAGIAFVGPTPQVIDGLGDKVKARQLATKINVPVVPGTPGAIEKYSDGDAFIKEHGFPVIIKAAMGGGGRGMRVVWEEKDFKDSFERATSEAKTAFGDGTVFVERFLYRPKHIEVS